MAWYEATGLWSLIEWQGNCSDSSFWLRTSLENSREMKREEPPSRSPVL